MDTSNLETSLRATNPPLDPVIRQAFTARAFVLRTLWRPGSLAEQLARLPDLFNSKDGWHLFLRTERCTIRLREVIQGQHPSAELPDWFQQLLDREADWEMSHVSSARGTLSEIGAWAAADGCRPVVLKGGLYAIGHERADLNDLDILLPRLDAERLAATMLEWGFTPIGFSTPRHLNGLCCPGELPLELHVALGAQGDGDGISTAGIQPVAECPGIWRLAPGEQLWHVLRHTVAEHPSRRSRLRDLAVLRTAASRCAPEEIAAVRQHAERHLLAAELSAALDFTTAPPDSQTTDPFPELALASYLVAHREENRLRVHPTTGRMNDWVFALLLGSTERAALRAKTWERSSGPSGYHALRRVQRLNPQLGRGLQLTARLVIRTYTRVRASRVARWTRGQITRHLPDLQADTH